MDSEHRQGEMPENGTNTEPVLSPAQQQAVRQIEQMTPEQRRELQSRLAEMPQPQRVVVEETLRLYAQQVAVREAAHASLLRAMGQGTPTDADAQWEKQAARPPVAKQTSPAGETAQTTRGAAQSGAQTTQSAPGVATAQPQVAQSATQGAESALPTPAPSAQETAETLAAKESTGAAKPAPPVRTAQFARQDEETLEPSKRKRKEKTQPAQKSAHGKREAHTKEPQPMQTTAAIQPPVGQSDSKKPAQTRMPSAAQPSGASQPTSPQQLAGQTASMQPTASQPTSPQQPASQTASMQPTASQPTSPQQPAGQTASMQPAASQPTSPQQPAGQTASMQSPAAQPTTKHASGAKSGAAKSSGAHVQEMKERFRLFAERMQRGANDGALVEAREADTLPPRLVYNALGQVLYSIGLETEYMCVQLIRALRRVAVFAGVTVSSVLQAIFQPLRILVRGVSRDVSEPFIRFFSGTRNLFRVMSQAKRNGENAFSAGGAFLKRGLASYRKLLTASLSYLLPLAAAGVFALTAWSVLGREYSLEVHYNGEFLAFVENESVWEDAQKMVRSRIRAGSGEEFTAHPELIVRAVNTAARTNSRDLADDLIEASSDQIRKATGVYVNDTLVGVCDDIAGVQRMLESALNAAREGDETVRTSFVQNVAQVDGVYLTSSVVPLSQLESDMQSNNWLQVQVVRTITFEEALSFPTVEQENSKLYKGTTKVLQKGKDGFQEVTADVAYIDGQEVGRTVLSTNVLVEAVPKIVEIGTKQFSSMYDGPITPGSGVMIWPVPDYKYTTTEYAPGGHRGLDICAPYGAPVYACDGGTVITAGWHGSYGNYIQIDHGNGIVTLYAHNSALLVGVGQTVAPGQLIAQVGSTGNSSGNHVHLEVYVNGGRTNPRSYVSP